MKMPYRQIDGFRAQRSSLSQKLTFDLQMVIGAVVLDEMAQGRQINKEDGLCLSLRESQDVVAV